MDHYKILGLKENATKDEIKAAYKKLALEFHPDKHLQSSKAARDKATLRFRQISESYQLLMDDYDTRSRAPSAASGYDYNNNNYGGSACECNYDTHSRARARAPSAAAYYYYYYYYYNYNNNYGGSGSNYDCKARYHQSGTGSNANGFASKFRPFLRFLKTKRGLAHLGLAGAIIGGSLSLWIYRRRHEND